MKRTACAIYTRKSSDEGLELEFNSLDAQREACEAYIKSQKHEGWVCLPDLYDDGGLSGGSMDRPALKQLLADIEIGKVQTVVVYKVDRLTRSLADFAKIVDVLDAAGASFVSVTQQFNTTTSMGRLTLNMLLSFAQFEREIAGERIRDKIAASKAKGMWMGGNIPLGYDAVDRKLVINEAEAETVRTIFACYAELGSVRELREELDRRGIVSKRREGAGGVLGGGKRFSRGALYALLRNRIYAGEIQHGEKVYPGRHDRIVDGELWGRVQALLTDNRHDRVTGSNAKEPSLLAGLVIDVAGEPMTATHASKSGKRYRYYVSRSLLCDTPQPGPAAMRIPAGEIERLITDRLLQFCGSPTDVADGLAPLELDASSIEQALATSRRFHEQGWQALRPDTGAHNQRDVIRRLLDGATVGAEAIVLSISRAGLAAVLICQKATEAGSFNATTKSLPPIELPIAGSLSRSGKGKRIVVEAAGTGIDDGLVKLLRDAFEMRAAVCAMDTGAGDRHDLWTSTWRARRIALLRLAYLAPPIVTTILHGQQPPALSAKRLMALSKDLPFDWSHQAGYLGFS